MALANYSLEQIISLMKNKIKNEATVLTSGNAFQEKKSFQNH